MEVTFKLEKAKLVMNFRKSWFWVSSASNV